MRTLSAPGMLMVIGAKLCSEPPVNADGKLPPNDLTPLPNGRGG